MGQKRKGVNADLDIPPGTVISETSPDNPASGQLWWADSNVDEGGGRLYVWTGDEWVDTSLPSARSGGNDTSPWTRSDTDNFVHTTEAGDQVIINDNKPAELRGAKLRVVSSIDETHYFGGNERGLQIRDSTMGGNIGDGTTFMKATASGQWKFENNRGERFHISDEGTLTTPSYAVFGESGGNYINKFRGDICGFDVGSSASNDDLGRMRYDTSTHDWTISCNKKSRIIVGENETYLDRKFGCNGGSFGLHDGTRDEPTFILRNLGGKTYFMLSDAGSGLDMDPNSLRPYTMETADGKHLWETEGRFSSTLRLGDESLDTSGNSSLSNGLRFESNGRFDQSFASTTSSTSMMKLNRKRTNTGRFIEFKLMGTYCAEIRGDGDGKVALNGFSNVFRSGFDSRQLVTTTELTDASSLINQLNPNKEGFSTVELRQLIPEAVHGEEGAVIETGTYTSEDGTVEEEVDKPESIPAGASFVKTGERDVPVLVDPVVLILI